jgi:outer membrane receptor protein involved in Fe transport
VFNFNAGYKATKDTKWMLNVMNIFNRQYATAAQLGPAAFTANGGAYAANANQKSMFVAPGAPRSVWLSLGHSFN